MAANAESLAGRAFSGNVCSRVMLVAEWTLVRQGVAIYLGYFFIVELSIDDSEEGDSFFRVRDKPFV